MFNTHRKTHPILFQRRQELEQLSTMEWAGFASEDIEEAADEVGSFFLKRDGQELVGIFPVYAISRVVG